MYTMFPSQEIERDRTATICQGRVRERHAYTTISHRLQVVILGRTELIEQPMFLLKYKGEPLIYCIVWQCL